MVLGDVLTRDSGNAAWNVMVQRRRLGWRVAGGPLAEVELAVPPRIIIGVVNADAFADAVFGGASQGRWNISAASCASVRASRLLCERRTTMRRTGA